MIKPIASRTEPVQEALSNLQAEEISTDMIALYEKDLQTYMEFIETFDLSQNITVDDYTLITDEDGKLINERGKITYQEYISKSKQMINKGFTDLVARSAVQNIDDICRYMKVRVMSTLMEMAHKMSEIHTASLDKTTKAVAVLEENKVLNERNLLLAQQLELISKENIELKTLSEQAFDMLQKIEKKIDIKDTLTEKEIEQVQTFIPEVILPEEPLQENIDDTKTPRFAAKNKGKRKPIF
jgi:hypothetical protein